MRRMLAGQALLLSMVVAACTPSPSTAPPDPPPASATAQTSSTPSTSPTARTKAQDAADVKKALVRAQDLGSPWTQPKTVSTVKAKKGEICPGHTSAVDEDSMTAGRTVNLTEGKGAGKNIATFSVHTLADEDAEALVSAYKQDQKACARYKDGSGLFVVRSTEGPDSVDGVPLITSGAERIYYDKSHKQLAYARHYLVARQGRVLTYLSLAFLTVKKDPEAKDFRRASALLEVQLAKNARVFG